MSVTMSETHDHTAEFVTTIHGLMPVAALEKRTGVDENDNERAEWIEYWLDGVLVHRSVHLHLKTAIFADAIQAQFG